MCAIGVDRGEFEMQLQIKMYDGSHFSGILCRYRKIEIHADAVADRGESYFLSGPVISTENAAITVLRQIGETDSALIHCSEEEPGPGRSMSETRVQFFGKKTDRIHNQCRRSAPEDEIGTTRKIEF